MNHLQKGFLGKTNWWRYILTILILSIGISFFSIPQSIAIGNKTTAGLADASRLDDISYLMTLFDSNVNLIYMLLPFTGGLLFLFFCVKYIHQQAFKNLTTGRVFIDWNRILFSFLLWGGLTVLLVGIQYVVMPDTLVWNFQATEFLLLLVIALALVPIQTSLEEYFFRGYLLQALGILTKNRWFPLVFTSVLFGLAHMSNPEVNKLGPFLMIYYIGTGLFLGILALMDDGLELSIGFHAANNMITALLVTADWQVFQTYSIFKDISEPNLWLSILPSLIVFPLLLVFYAKKYKWTDWKGKLFGPVKAPLLEEDAV